MNQVTRWTLVVACALLAAGTARAADLKIGVVDAARVLKEYQGTQQAKEQLDAQVEEFSAERDKMMDEHKKMKETFEALREEAQNKALSETARDEKKKAAEQKLTDMLEYENKIRDTVAARKQQLMEQKKKMDEHLVGKIGSAVRSVAEKQGLQMVFDLSGVTTSGFPPLLFQDGSRDITDAVIQVLNAAGAPKKTE